MPTLTNATWVPVRLDHASLRGELEGSRTRYTVALLGGAAETWLDAYRTICEEARSPGTFSLDASRRTISFTCANVEGPAMVIDMLERLEAVLGLADRRYQSWYAASGDGRGSSFSPRPSIAP